MPVEAITAPYGRFLEGLSRMHGCCIEEEGRRVSLAFEPGFLESPDRHDLPCLRLAFRKVGDRAILESFVVCDGREERRIDLAAAHDALQAWMDAVSD